MFASGLGNPHPPGMGPKSGPGWRGGAGGLAFDLLRWGLIVCPPSRGPDRPAGARSSAPGDPDLLRSRKELALLDVHAHARLNARNLRVTARALALAGAIFIPGVLLAPSALAQIANLPPGVNSRAQLTPDDEKAITTFLDAYKAKLTGTDLDDLRDARKNILQTLQPQNVSVDYKLKLGSQLVPLIRQLVDSGDEVKVVNGLFMAGELGTQPCVEVMTSKLADPKTTIRLAAAAAINRALESLSGSAPAMQAGGAGSLVNAVASQLQAEKDPIAADPMVRAMVAGVNISAANLSDVRTSAFAKLCTIMTERTAAMESNAPSDRELENLIRAGSAIRDALTGAGGKNVPQSAVKDAAALSGEYLAYVKRLLKDGVYPQISKDDPAEAQASKLSARAGAVQLVSVAENIAFYALATTATQPPAQTALAQSLRSGTTANDARFAEDVKALIGPQGSLVKTYSFAADRFSK